MMIIEFKKQPEIKALKWEEPFASKIELQNWAEVHNIQVLASNRFEMFIVEGQRTVILPLGHYLVRDYTGRLETYDEKQFNQTFNILKHEKPAGDIGKTPKRKPGRKVKRRAPRVDS